MFHTVLTSENITFRYEVAGLSSRLIAFLIDGLVILLLIQIIFQIVSLLALISKDMANAFLIVGFFVLNMGYFAFMEWIFKGQSLGKKAMNLRVISERGLRPSLYQTIMRNVFRIIDQLPLAYLTGIISAILSPAHKRLGDIVAGTLVIKESKQRFNIPAFREWESYNTLYQDSLYRNQVLRKISLAEKELLIDLILRADRLLPQKRVEIFSEFADFFENKAGLPRPEFLSPEKFVKNITYVLTGKPA